MKRLFSTKVNSNAVNIWLLIARIAIGVIVLTHGLPKLDKLMAGNVQLEIRLE
jgi:putative oxidoreductase